jgi:hypothetical protein
MELEKFDLERALAGEPVITRDSKEVTQLTLFKVKNTSYPLHGVLDNLLYKWTEDGKFFSGGENHEADLFMKPKIVEKFYNVYYNKEQNYLLLAGTYETKAEAKEIGKTADHYVKTIRVTNEPN